MGSLTKDVWWRIVRLVVEPASGQESPAEAEMVTCTVSLSRETLPRRRSHFRSASKNSVSKISLLTVEVSGKAEGTNVADESTLERLIVSLALHLC